MQRPNLTANELRFLDKIFEMESGYVLDFSNKTFGRFFVESVGVDIDAERFAVEGESKAKRLRYFLKTEPRPIVCSVLTHLWNYRSDFLALQGKPEPYAWAKSKLDEILGSLSAADGTLKTPTQAQAPVGDASVSPFEKHRSRLLSELRALFPLEPQARGYAFERFLTTLFNSAGLQAREAFRLRGEQIDGSFVLDNEVYLVEAKWQHQPIGSNPLHAFAGTVRNKSAITRGVFISESGFSADGLEAFGRGGSIICVSGRDLFDTLDRQLLLEDVLRRKLRRLAETGMPFSEVFHLYPA